MLADNYYLLSALPALGALGTLPEVDFKGLFQWQHCKNGRAILRIIALAEDLLLWQEQQAGVQLDSEPLILSSWQLEAEQLLTGVFECPANSQVLLREEDGWAGDIPWRVFFEHAFREAERLDSRFLFDWTAFEWNLRGELLRCRAERLDAAAHTGAAVAPAASEPLGKLSVELSRVEHPLAALQAVERFRWQWLQTNDRWYEFSRDEIAAYGAKLLTLQRWNRVQRGVTAGQCFLQRLGLTTPPRPGGKMRALGAGGSELRPGGS